MYPLRRKAPESRERLKSRCLGFALRKAGAFMKKTFPLTAPGKDDARVRDKIRRELNKYVRRELQKKLPEGFTRWTFDCKVGRDEATATSRLLKEVGSAIDDAAAKGASEVYVEIVARPMVRPADR